MGLFNNFFFFFHFLGDPFFVSAVLDHVSRFSKCFESHGLRYLGDDDFSVQFCGRGISGFKVIKCGSPI